MKTQEQIEIDKDDTENIHIQYVYFFVLFLVPFGLLVRDSFLFVTHFLKTGKVLNLTALNFLKKNFSSFENLYSNTDHWVGLKLILDNTLGFLPFSIFLLGTSWLVLLCYPSLLVNNFSDEIEENSD